MLSCKPARHVPEKPSLIGTLPHPPHVGFPATLSTTPCTVLPRFPETVAVLTGPIATPPLSPPVSATHPTWRRDSLVLVLRTFYMCLSCSSSDPSSFHLVGLLQKPYSFFQVLAQMVPSDGTLSCTSILDVELISSHEG